MSGRTSAWWRGFWEQAILGGDTMVNTRIICAWVQEMVNDMAELEKAVAALRGIAV